MHGVCFSMFLCSRGFTSNFAERFKASRLHFNLREWPLLANWGIVAFKVCERNAGMHSIHVSVFKLYIYIFICILRHSFLVKELLCWCWKFKGVRGFLIKQRNGCKSCIFIDPFCCSFLTFIHRQHEAKKKKLRIIQTCIYFNWSNSGILNPSFGD